MLYEFECQEKECQKKFDKLLSLKDKDDFEKGKKKIECEYCKSTNIKRTVGRLNFSRFWDKL